MGNQDRRNTGVIINDLAFGKSGRRVEDLFEIRQLEVLAFNFDDLICGQFRLRLLGCVVSNAGLSVFYSCGGITSHRGRRGAQSITEYYIEAFAFSSCSA